MEKLKETAQQIKRRILLTVTLSLTVGAALLIWVPMDEKVMAHGVLLSEKESYLYAPEEGLITRVDAREGANVRAGDPILSLDTQELQKKKMEIEAQLQEAEATVRLKQARLEKISKLPLPKEFWYARSELVEMEQKRRHAALELERFDQLLKERLSSQSEYDAHKLADDLARSELDKARERVHILDRGLEESIRNEALADFQAATARLHHLKLDLSLCQEQMERRQLCSPMDGKIAFLMKCCVGKRVVKGEEIAHLWEGEATHARLFVNESQVHRIKPGQTIQMKSHVFEFMRYGYITAQVEEISMEPDLSCQETSSHERNYQVMARIEKSPQPLILGSGVEARIILQRVPLWRMLMPKL